MTTRPAVPTAAAHIHEGEAGVAGDLVVTLEAPAEIAGSGFGLATGCPFSRWYGRGGGPKLGSTTLSPIRAPDLLDALRFRERDPVECRVLDGVGSGTNQLFLSNGHSDGARSSGPPEGGSL